MSDTNVEQHVEEEDLDDGENAVEIPEEKVQKATEKMRELFAKEAKESPEKYYQSDVDRIAEDDFYCHRFVKHQGGSGKKSLKMVKESLKWRKEFGVQDIKESNLNVKCLQAKIVYPFFKDREGREMLFLTVKNIRYDDDVKSEDIQKLLVYWIEYFEKKQGSKGITFITNCSGAGLNNVDMGVIWLNVNILTTYYPNLIRSIIVYEMPSVFSSLWSLIKMALPKSLVKLYKFVNKDSISKHVEESNLSTVMGGTNEYEYEPFKDQVIL